MTTQTETRFRPADSLANRLVLIRRELGLSQREAAIRCGVGFGSWQSWEKGAAPRNALRDLLKVSERLGVDRDWLMFGGPLRTEEPEIVAPTPLIPVQTNRPAGISGQPGYSTVDNEITRARKLIPLTPVQFFALAVAA